MQIVGTEDLDNGLTILIADQPADTDGTAGAYIFNGPYEVATNEVGTSQKGRWARAIGDGSAATAGERWQPVVASWTIEPGGGPFIMAGDDQIETDVVQVFLEPAGGGGGAVIEYSITSISTAASGDYTGLVIASVEVIGAPCDRSALIGTTLDVVDHSGCIFDLASDSLAGVIGWAFEGIYESLDAEADPGTLSPCHWAALNRCCADGEGGGGAGGGDVDGGAP
jgi:hypothetical protein